MPSAKWSGSTRACRRSPDSPTWPFLRGDRINAVVFWRQAIELGQGLPSENLAWARVQLGITHFALGDLSQADS